MDPTDDPAIDSHMTESVITRVYLALVQQPTPSRTLLVAQGLPSSTVDRALGVLNARGLIRLTAADTWEVVPPDIALPAHAAELERRARAVRGAAHELSQVFFQARSSDRPRTEGVRSLYSLDDLHSASAEIVSAARTSRAGHAGPLPPDRGAVRGADGRPPGALPRGGRHRAGDAHDVRDRGAGDPGGR